MTGQQIDAQIAGIVLAHNPDLIAVRETLLPIGPFPNAAGGLAPRNGLDLAEQLEDLGPRAVLEIEFNFAQAPDWTAWPKVRLKHLNEACHGRLVEGSIRCA